MKRTIKLRLTPSPTQATVLSDTVTQFTSAFNQASGMGWEAGISNATKLHYLVYYPIKAANPTLVSDLLNQARVKAAEALRSAFTLKRKGRKVSAPRSLACPPRYNLHTYKLDWESCTVRMSTTAGRMTFRFDVPSYCQQYAGYPVDTADLIERNGAWWLHVVVTVPAPIVEPTDAVVGVDLGLAQPAVTSANLRIKQGRKG